MSSEATTTQTTPAPATPAQPQTLSDVLKDMAAKNSAPESPSTPESSEEAAPPAPAEPKAAESKTAGEIAMEASKKDALSREELRKRQQSIKEAAEKRKFAQERDAFAKDVEEYQAIKGMKATKDAWGQLKALGWESPEAFNAALAQGALTPERKELLEIKTKLQQQEQEKVNREYAAQLDSARRKVVEFLSSDEKYELSRLNNGPDTVLQVMSQHYEATKDPETGVGESLSFEEAANMVESYLETELDKIFQVGKVKKKYGAKAEAPAKPQSSATRETPRSLSNKLSASTAPASEESDEQRLRKAADGLKEMFAKRFNQ